MNQYEGTSPILEMQEQMNPANDPQEFHAVESNHNRRLSYDPSQPAGVPNSHVTLSCVKRLPLDTWNVLCHTKTLLEIKFSTFDSSPKSFKEFIFQRHQEPQHRFGCPPVGWTPVARDEHRIRAQFQLPSTKNSSIPVDIPQNSLQRQQISETSIRQIHKSPIILGFGRYDSKIRLLL